MNCSRYKFTVKPQFSQSDITGDTATAINIQKFKELVERAKSKATGNARRINAIDRAAYAIINGKWIVTELADGIAVTTESGKTYFANGHCQCGECRRGAPRKQRAAQR